MESLKNSTREWRQFKDEYQQKSEREIQEELLFFTAMNFKYLKKIRYEASVIGWILIIWSLLALIAGCLGGLGIADTLSRY